MEIHRGEYEPEISPEIGHNTDQSQKKESIPEVAPRLEEIISEKTPTKKHPSDIGVVIGSIEDEEKKEKERQKKIEEIIQKRDNPKRIH